MGGTLHVFGSTLTSDEVLIPQEWPRKARGPILCHIRGEPEVERLVSEEVEDTAGHCSFWRSLEEIRTVTGGLEGRTELGTQLGDRQHTAVWTVRRREGSLEGRVNVWMITNAWHAWWVRCPKSRRQSLRCRERLDGPCIKR